MRLNKNTKKTILSAKRSKNEPQKSAATRKVNKKKNTKCNLDVADDPVF